MAKFGRLKISYNVDDSGCNKFMLGRGLLANPFLANQITDYIHTGSYVAASWKEVVPLLP